MSKIFTNLKRVNLSLFFLSLTIITYFFLSLDNLSYQLLSPDTSRDYLISERISKYLELPATGPVNSLVVAVKNSPVYFYLMAFFIKISDEPNFIGFINIIFQIISIATIYLLGKTLFGAFVGLIASAMFAFSPAVIYSSTFFWQPSVMNPFVNLSYLLLALSATKDRFNLTILSVVTFILATAIHPSTLAVLPMFLAAVLWLLRKRHGSKKEFLQIFASGFLTSLVLFITVLIHKVTTDGNFYVNLNGKFVNNFNDLLSSFLTNLGLFSSHLASAMQKLPVTSQEAFMWTVTLIALGFVWKRKILQPKEGEAIIFLVGSLATFFLLSSLVTIKIRLDHFIPITGLLFVLWAVLLSKLTLHKSALKVLLVIFVIWLTNFPSTVSTAFNFNQSTNILYEKSPLTESVNAINEEVRSIQLKDGFKEPNFFHVIHYEVDKKSATRVYNAAYLVLLERSLHYKLATINDSSWWGYISQNSREYLFITCYLVEVEEEKSGCLEKFSKELVLSLLSDQIGPYLPYTNPEKLFSNTSHTVYVSKKL